jgi:hypothetical protein
MTLGRSADPDAQDPSNSRHRTRWDGHGPRLTTTSSAAIWFGGDVPSYAFEVGAGHPLLHCAGNGATNASE